MSVQSILVCMKDGLILACVSGSAENYSALVFKNQEVRNKFEYLEKALFVHNHRWIICGM
jgi:hypothetical protein